MTERQKSKLFFWIVAIVLGILLIVGLVTADSSHIVPDPEIGGVFIG